MQLTPAGYWYSGIRVAVEHQGGHFQLIQTVFQAALDVQITLNGLGQAFELGNIRLT